MFIYTGAVYYNPNSISQGLEVCNLFYHLLCSICTLWMANSWTVSSQGYIQLYLLTTYVAAVSTYIATIYMLHTYVQSLYVDISPVIWVSLCVV